MADLERGYTFTDGGTGTAANLHSLIDAGTILPAFISAKSAAAPAGVDSFVYYKSGVSDLRRCTLTTLIANFPQGGGADVFALRQLGTTSAKAAAGNDARFSQFMHGIRLADGDGTDDTPATPKDLDFDPIDLSALTEIDWDTGNIFTDDLGAHKTYTFANVRLGRAVTLIFKLNGHTVTLPAGTGVASVGTGTDYWYVQLTKSSLGILGTGMNI